MDNHSRDNSWREFQSEYIVQKKKREHLIRTVKSFMGILTLIFLFTGIFLLNIEVPEKNKQSSSIAEKTPKEASQAPALTAATLSSAPSLPAPPVSSLPASSASSLPASPASPSIESGKFSKETLAGIISKTDISKTDNNIIFVDTPQTRFKIFTSIDVELQEYLLSLITQMKHLTRGKPQRIAFVVMEPDTGKIIAMAGYDLDKPQSNPCLESDYPAASVFKIVTASAAVETLGYDPETQLYFNGNKYTLYKGQVKDTNKKSACQISFSSAFAESVNPVFGKIGKNHLGKERLESYANAFGFNQLVRSELPFVSGNFETDSNEFHLAELGSGFNYDTTISPVFGAMLISTVVNKGRAMIPTLVENVTNADGDIVYKSAPAVYKSAITPKTADTMMQIMQKTITKGTARKSFRNASSDPVLSMLIMGGKTGSLNNREHTIKYDWFTGFGKEKNTDKKIAMAIVVGHGEYIGTKSSAYGNMILKHYFKNKSDAHAHL